MVLEEHFANHEKMGKNGVGVTVGVTSWSDKNEKLE